MAKLEQETRNETNLQRQVEVTHADLRHSIALNRQLVEQTQRVLDHHRQRF